MNTELLKITEPLLIPKAWGDERWIHNSNGYCGKVLFFKKGAKFSMHFHIEKHETWFVASGLLELTWINPQDASRTKEILKPGMVVVIPPGNSHQLRALEKAEIFEVSTLHRECDSYRVEPGDSQKKG